MKIHKHSDALIPVLALVLLLAVTLACGDTASEPEPEISTATAESAPISEEVDLEEEQLPETTEETAEVPPEETAEDPTEEPSPTEPPPSPTPEDIPTYLGDFYQEFGYFLGGITVEDPALPGILYQPTEGTKLIAVEVIVGNISSDPISINPLDATLVDNEGFTYQTELGGRNGQIELVDLFPGEKVRGWVSFDVPEGASASSIKWSESFFGSDYLQVGLETPPEGHVPFTDPLSVLPEEQEAKLGDLVENYGYSLSAVTVEDPAVPGIIYDPKIGHKLVAVEIVVGNVDGELLSVNPLDSYLVDSEGFVYGTELGGREGQLELVDLAPGEKVKGWVSFTIPEDAIPDSVKFSLGAFSSTYLQTGLTQGG